MGIRREGKMNEDSFFAVDKIEHLFLFFYLGHQFQEFIHCWWVTFLLCLVIGLGIEIIEMFPIWGWFMRRLGEDDGLQTSISYKDILVNILGTLMGELWI